MRRSQAAVVRRSAFMPVWKHGLLRGRWARARTVLVTLLAVLGATLAMALPAGAGTATAVEFTNPLASSPYGADPWMGYYQGNYYLADTTWNSQVVIKKASSVTALAATPAKTVYTGSGATACCNMWAPSLHLLDGPNGRRWYLYLSLGPQACCDGQRSFVLESAGTDPMGPYSMKGQLNAMPGNGWAIDGSVMSLNGSNYFLYSAFGSDRKQDLFIAPMSNPWTLSAYGSQISSPTYGWETVGNPVNEAPFAVEHGSDTFISFSASSCNTSSYAVGLLRYTGGSPLDSRSWFKEPDPMLSSNPQAGVYGTGGQGFFNSPDGSETWMVYHANDTASQGCGASRTTRIQRVSWNAGGLPTTSAALSTSTRLTVPSGDGSSGGTSGPTQPVTSTPPSTSVNTNATYVLTARHSGKVLDVPGGAGAAGTAIDQATLRTSATQQQWRLTPVSGGYRIVSVGSGMALDVSGASTADGARILQWPATGAANQTWSLSDAGSGYVTLHSLNSGKVLDVEGRSEADGAPLIQWPANGGPNQQWKLTSVSSGAGPVTPPATSAPVTGPPATSAPTNVPPVTTPPASPPNPGAVRGDVQTHDPSMARGPDGTYVVVSTAPGIAIRTSTDRVEFSYRGTAFPQGAPWTDAYTKTSDGNLWAPDISYHDGRFWLYYAASTFGSNYSAVFLATSPTGLPGTWTNRGQVVSTSSGSGYNAIDPNLYVAPDGRWWLTFGSFWGGIEQVELDRATGMPLGGGWSTVAARPGSTAVEAPFVFANGGYYYLFTSWDLCCMGSQSTYRIMVGRSTSPQGPFVDRNGQRLTQGGGTQILAGHGRYAGPGGQSVMADVDADLLVYHYYDTADNGVAKLGINRLGWTGDGWPFVY